MIVSGIPTCSYPSMVVCIDDSRDFLMNFSLQLDPNLPYRLFDSPQEVLNWLEHQQENQLILNCFSQYEDAVGNPATNHTIKLDLSFIMRKVYEPTRFDEISVIVVDYAMPHLNGLELCAKLKEKPFKKILLTGQADAQTAIDAFNRGIIDRFILKSDVDVIQKINSSISELQQTYFREKSDFMVKALSIDSLNYLQDKTFIKLFNEIYHSKKIVEFYLTENTGTFLLLNAKGKAYWLVIMSKLDLESYCEFGKDLGVERHVLEQLQSGQYLIHFWQTKRTYNIDPIEWESYLYPAQKIEDTNTYYYSVIENPEISQVDVDGITPFNTYLEKLDHSTIVGAF